MAACRVAAAKTDTGAGTVQLFSAGAPSILKRSCSACRNGFHCEWRIAG
jgi:hypothetical protein